VSAYKSVAGFAFKNALYYTSAIAVYGLWQTMVKPKFHLAIHVTSRHDSTRSMCRVRREERVEPCCRQTRHSQNVCRTCFVSRRDV